MKGGGQGALKMFCNWSVMPPVWAVSAIVITIDDAYIDKEIP